MKIAILGWGSIIWDPRELPREGVWKANGPKLPLEFSRISRDARLTLVIDTTNGKSITTMFVLSPRTSLQDAKDDLRKRAYTSDENIGWVDIVHKTDSKKEHSKQTDVHGIVTKWCRRNGYDGAVWTALRSNFKKETGADFSVDTCLQYLDHLPNNVRSEALKYIRNAPECVKTSVRNQVKKKFGEQ